MHFTRRLIKRAIYPIGNASCVAWQRRRTRWLRYWVSE